MANSLVNTSVANGGVVGFAGSRHGSVQKATALVSALSSQGVSFLVGCAPGVDHSFRQALVAYPFCTTVHCAFPARARQIAQSGFKAVCRVGNTPSAAAALHRRTVGMVADCTLSGALPRQPPHRRLGPWLQLGVSYGNAAAQAGLCRHRHSTRRHTAHPRHSRVALRCGFRLPGGSG